MSMHRLTEDDRAARYADGLIAGRALRDLHKDNPETLARLIAFDRGMVNGSISTEFQRGRADGMEGLS